MRILSLLLLVAVSGAVNTASAADLTFTHAPEKEISARFDVVFERELPISQARRGAVTFYVRGDRFDCSLQLSEQAFDIEQNLAGAIYSLERARAMNSLANGCVLTRSGRYVEDQEVQQYLHVHFRSLDGSVRLTCGPGRYQGTDLEQITLRDIQDVLAGSMELRTRD